VVQRIVSAQNVLPAAISRMEEALGWLRWRKAEHAAAETARDKALTLCKPYFGTICLCRIYPPPPTFAPSRA
jgi:hypothetical protein